MEGKFTVFTTKSGLFDDVAFGILEDDRGDLWMSCNKGVYRASRRNLEAFARGKVKAVPCVAYGRADGLKTSECNGATQPCVWKGRGGRLFFATAKGYGVIDPADIRTNPNPPPVVIEQVLADGRPLLGTKLTPGRHRLEFEYTGLSLVAPEKIRFKYRLAGLESEWVGAGTKREAVYAALPPGTYTFQVIACNNDGIWNEKGASFHFVIEPRFYQTKRFVVICILLGAVAVALTVQLRTRRLLNRQRELEQEVAVRTAQLAAANEELQRLTKVDTLTGTASRRHLYELLETEWRRGRRVGDPVSLLMADIDLFKAYNDTFGHPAGDECLQRVAATLRGSLRRPSDVVGRYGGEEFLVVLPATGEEGARQVAEAMRSGVEALAIPAADTRISPVVTLSVGVATAVPDEDSLATDLVEEADRALYRAKQSGRNRVEPAVVRT
jgi:diguanylate cyclase (GGDEF)-like protein